MTKNNFLFFLTRKGFKTIYLLQEKIEKLEEDKKRRLQLYVFVSRCIAHPFNAKQPTDMTRRHTKLTPHQLETIQARFQVNKTKNNLRIKTEQEQNWFHFHGIKNS